MVIYSFMDLPSLFVMGVQFDKLPLFVGRNIDFFQISSKTGLQGCSERNVTEPKNQSISRLVYHSMNKPALSVVAFLWKHFCFATPS